MKPNSKNRINIGQHSTPTDCRRTELFQPNFKLPILLLLLPLLSNCITNAESNQSTVYERYVSELPRSLTDEKIYNKDIRPNYGGPPIKVNISIVVNDISSVSEINMDFTMDFYFRQYWHDPRLAFEPIGNTTELTLATDFVTKIWLPDTFIRNSRSMTTQLSTSNSQTNTMIRVKHNGDVLYSTRLTATAYCPMNLRYFPVDKQHCKLILASYGYSVKDLEYNFVPGNKSFVLSDQIFLPTFFIRGFKQYKYVETFSTGTFGRLVCELFLERSYGYYLHQIYVPAFLIVIISWVPFWLDREDNHARVGLGVTTVLTMTTLTTNTNSSLPKISYIKAIDVYLIVCFTMVFLSLIEYATVGFFESKRNHDKIKSIKRSQKLSNNNNNNNHHSNHNNDKITDPNNIVNLSIIDSSKKRPNPTILQFQDSSNIDKYSRYIFPSAFFIFNIVYVIVCICYLT